MDTKNVIAAISLSAAVIILYSLFWAPSPQELKEANDERNKVVETTEAPSLEVEEKVLEEVTKDEKTVEGGAKKVVEGTKEVVKKVVKKVAPKQTTEEEDTSADNEEE